MTFWTIRFKMIVVHTNWTEMSFHKADKGHMVSFVKLEFPSWYVVFIIYDQKDMYGRILLKIICTEANIYVFIFLSSLVSNFWHNLQWNGQAQKRSVVTSGGNLVDYWKDLLQALVSWYVTKINAIWSNEDTWEQSAIPLIFLKLIMFVC